MTHEDFVNANLSKLRLLKDITIDDVRNVLHINLQNVKLVEESTELVEVDPNDKRASILARFLACKMVEGCSQKTIGYYRQVIHKMMTDIPKQIDQLTTDDIRFWLAIRVQRDKIGKCSQDNERRILNSFFNWAEDNEVIFRSPMRRVKKIKQEKKVKKPFSDVEVEKLRVAAQGDLRLTAVLEMLLSTGMRVGEMHLLNRDSVDGDEAIVYGKGAKERVVFLNARARVALQIYEDSRPETDTEPALFAGEVRPHRRLSITCYESMLRELGKKAGIQDVHPHRFRRTAATMALNRGMPIDQVQQMLGHEQIATTLIYAKSSRETLKRSHQKLMG